MLFRNAVLSCICSALLLLLAGASHAQEWNQWRGPNRDARLSKSRLPARWPETLPAPKWRVPVGIGYSSPVVSNGKVFVTGRDEAGHEICLSLDAGTGKELWKHSYASTFAPPDPTAGKGPNATPTVDKDRVYTLGLGGMFHCFDAKTGRILWKHDFAAEYWGVEKDEEGLDRWFPVCGASSSPLVLGEQVIVSVGGKKAGAFTAFDRNTGKILWKALDDRSSYASPQSAAVAGIPQIIGFTGLRMVGLSTETKALLWEFPFKAMFEQTIVSPIVWNNRVIVCGEARPATALEFTRNGGKLTFQEVWKSAELATYLVTPVVFQDHLLGFDQRGRRLACVDLATGKTAWTSPRIGKQFISLTIVGEQVLVLSDSGEMHILATRTDEYTPLAHWKVTEPGAVWSNPAIAENRLFIRDADHLTCYEFPRT